MKALRIGVAMTVAACAVETAALVSDGGSPTGDDAGVTVDTAVDAAHDAAPVDAAAPDDDYGDAEACDGDSGSLDETWGDAGEVWMTFPSENGPFRISIPIRTVYLDPQDHALTATYITRSSVATVIFQRFLDDGTIDKTFGDVSRVIPFCHGNGCPPAGSVEAIASVDSEPAAVGHGLDLTRSPISRDFMIYRVATDGGVSTAYDGGRAFVDFGSRADEFAHTMAFASNGRIVLAGVQENNRELPHFSTDVERHFAIVRILRSGEVDPSFGKQIFDGGLNASIPGMVARPDDSLILLARIQGSSTNVIRVAPDGGFVGVTTVPTSGFDGGASGEEYPPYDLNSGIVIDSKGRTVVSDGPITRILPNGTLDPSFGDGGTVTLDTKNAAVFLADAKGRVIVWTERGAVRLREDGTEDPTYVPHAVPPTRIGRQAFAKGCRVVQAAGPIRRFKL